MVKGVCYICKDVNSTTVWKSVCKVCKGKICHKCFVKDNITCDDGYELFLDSGVCIKCYGNMHKGGL